MSGFDPKIMIGKTRRNHLIYPVSSR